MKFSAHVFTAALLLVSASTTTTTAFTSTTTAPVSPAGVLLHSSSRHARPYSQRLLAPSFSRSTASTPSSPWPLHVVTTPAQSESDVTANGDSAAAKVPNDNDDSDNSMLFLPPLGDDGVYHISSKEEHAALLHANPDKLIILKVFAPWCRACKGLEPKFLKIVHDPAHAAGKIPIIFASLSIQHNKAFVQQLGVLALPTIQFYKGAAVRDNFPCGPSKVPILKRKLTQFINDTVDPVTLQLKQEEAVIEPTAAAASSSTATGAAPAVGGATEAMTVDERVNNDHDNADDDDDDTLETAAGVPVVETQPLRKFGQGRAGTSTSNNNNAAAAANLVSNEDRKRWKETIPYLADLSLADFDSVLSKVKVLQFEPGSILMREGRRGRTFYILKSGEVEICQKTMMMADPLTAAPSQYYLGTVINRLGSGDYFGERALITGEPRAASIRATDKVTCWAFDKNDFPFSSVLSGRTNALTEDLKEQVNDKYGVNVVDLYQHQVDQQNRDSSSANQVRGSPNTPEILLGVDTEEEVADDGVADQGVAVENDAIFSLLSRFKMIRLVSRCFQYIVSTRVRWGDEGIRKRRSMLVSRLTPAQRAEYIETFKLIDASGDGVISLLELKRVMESIGDTKSDQEVTEMINKGHDAIDGESVLTFQDFMGIMAETEFYHLFRDIFATLDTDDTGFVKAGDLEHVLCGVRDLISDDRKSIIDVEDNILIDYEQFSRMLLGTALV